ncbi:MAG TPA: hypothetical protein VMV13_05040 [Candidatus Binataceae bacterium]|nr:hypothetical protein [Candidatus Binataceae bacterium]
MRISNTHNNRNRIAAYALAAMLAMPIGPLAGSLAQAQTAPAAGATPVQVPQPNEGGVNWPGAGYGAAALLGNVLYIPAKLVYAVLGGIGGGAAFLLTAGNTQTANTIWRSSLGGDYVLTPQMVAGEEPINFSGPTETAPTPPDNSGASAVQPMAPMPPPAAPVASTGSGYPSGSQPMDNGSGPVRNAPALPSTSIE